MSDKQQFEKTAGIFFHLPVLDRVEVLADLEKSATTPPERKFVENVHVVHQAALAYEGKSLRNTRDQATIAGKSVF